MPPSYRISSSEWQCLHTRQASNADESRTRTRRLPCTRFKQSGPCYRMSIVYRHRILRRSTSHTHAKRTSERQKASIGGRTSKVERRTPVSIRVAHGAFTSAGGWTPGPSMRTSASGCLQLTQDWRSRRVFPWIVGSKVHRLIISALCPSFGHLTSTRTVLHSMVQAPAALEMAMSSFKATDRTPGFASACACGLTAPAVLAQA